MLEDHIFAPKTMFRFMVEIRPFVISLHDFSKLCESEGILFPWPQKLTSQQRPISEILILWFPVCRISFADAYIGHFQTMYIAYFQMMYIAYRRGPQKVYKF